MAEHQKSRRLYKVWKGNNKFLCAGRLIFGPDAASVLLTTTLIAGPSLTFCYQVISKILSHDKSDQSKHVHVLGIPVLIVTLVIMISDLIFLYTTSSRDPGIVPRNNRPPEADESFNLTTQSVEWINGRAPNLRLPRTKDVIVNGFAIKVKYCDTCMLYRPPRASHCSVCNNCIQKFDHHCPWVGQCIGLRNYRFFYLFISTSTFLCIYVFTLSWINIITEKGRYHNSILKSMTGEILSLVLIVYTFIAVWFVGGLTVFHTYLISTNQTTYENFRYRYDKKDNPYSKGALKNFGNVFFSKIPPSANDFRAWVNEEAIEVGPYTPNSIMDMMSPKAKIDLETGYKHSTDVSGSMPTLLQDLDYGSMGDDLSVKGRAEDEAFDPFIFPVTQEASPHGSSDSTQSSESSNIATSEEHDDKGSNGVVDEKTANSRPSNETLTSAGEDVQMLQK